MLKDPRGRFGRTNISLLSRWQSNRSKHLCWMFAMSFAIQWPELVHSQQINRYYSAPRGYSPQAITPVPLTVPRAPQAIGPSYAPNYVQNVSPIYAGSMPAANRIGTPSYPMVGGNQIQTLNPPIWNQLPQPAAPEHASLPAPVNHGTLHPQVNHPLTPSVATIPSPTDPAHPTIPDGPTVHIDGKAYPAAVLDCPTCRRNLGFAPLSDFNETPSDSQVAVNTEDANTGEIEQSSVNPANSSLPPNLSPSQPDTNSLPGPETGSSQTLSDNRSAPANNMSADASLPRPRTLTPRAVEAMQEASERIMQNQIANEAKLRANQSPSVDTAELLDVATSELSNEPIDTADNRGVRVLGSTPETNLQGVPPRVRQELLNNLEIPEGGRVLSLNVLEDQKVDDEKPAKENSELPPPAAETDSPEIAIAEVTSAESDGMAEPLTEDRSDATVGTIANSEASESNDSDVINEPAVSPSLEDPAADSRESIPLIKIEPSLPGPSTSSDQTAAENETAMAESATESRPEESTAAVSTEVEFTAEEPSLEVAVTAETAVKEAIAEETATEEAVAETSVDEVAATVTEVSEEPVSEVRVAEVRVAEETGDEETGDAVPVTAQGIAMATSVDSATAPERTIIRDDSETSQATIIAIQVESKEEIKGNKAIEGDDDGLNHIEALTADVEELRKKLYWLAKQHKTQHFGNEMKAWAKSIEVELANLRERVEQPISTEQLTHIELLSEQLSFAERSLEIAEKNGESMQRVVYSLEAIASALQDGMSGKEQTSHKDEQWKQKLQREKEEALKRLSDDASRTEKKYAQAMQKLKKDYEKRLQTDREQQANQINQLRSRLRELEEFNKQKVQKLKVLEHQLEAMRKKALDSSK